MITQEQFREYVRIQNSGLTNMFHVKQVCRLAKNLTETDCFEIMEKYDELSNQYPEAQK